MKEPYITYIVSEGTLNPEHLRSAFAAECRERLGEDAYAELARELAGLDVDQQVDALFGALQSVAPAGTIFSTHPDDGACFGFFAADDAD